MSGTITATNLHPGHRIVRTTGWGSGATTYTETVQSVQHRRIGGFNGYTRMFVTTDQGTRDYAPEAAVVVE